MAFVLDHIETGETTFPDNGSGDLEQTVTLSATLSDTSKAFLFFQVSATDGGPSQVCIRGQITDTDELTFTRDGDGVACTVRWYVVEGSDGISVQRGTANGDGSNPDVDVTISAVDLSETFVIVTSETNGGTHGADDTFTSALTSATNLKITSGAASMATSKIHEWQVVSIEGISVQRDSVTLGSGSTSVTDAITAVTLAQSSLLITYLCGNYSQTSRHGVRGYFSDTDELTFERVDSFQAITISWEVIDWGDVASVQHIAVAFPDTDGSEADTISSVDTSRCIVHSAGWAYCGGAGGDTAENEPASIGTLFTFASSTSLASDRDNTDGALTITAFVVEFVESGQELTASVVGLDAVVPAPTVAPSGAAPITAAAVVGELTAPTATIAGSGTATITAAAVAGDLAIPAPAISGAGAAELTASAVVGQLTVVSPAIAAGTTISPDPVALAASAPAATISGAGAAELTAPAVVGDLAIPAPTIAGAGAVEITATAVGAALAVLSPTISGAGAAEITASPAVGDLAIPAPAISGAGAAELTAPAVVGDLTVVSPAIANANQIAPSPVVLALTPPAATIAGSGVAALTASAIAVVLSIVTPTIAVVTANLTITLDGTSAAAITLDIYP